MKHYLYLFFLVIFLTGLAQEKPNYFPQEELVHPNNKEGLNNNDFLYLAIQQPILEILNKNLAKKYFFKDTIIVCLSFSVDKKGRLNKGGNYVTVNDTTIKKQTRNKLNNVFNDFPRFKIKNRKSKKHTSIHKLYYSFLTPKKNDPKQLEIITPKNLYTGGEIFEVPIFPGCIGTTSLSLRHCFNNKVQEHIKKHFRYPEIAETMELSGRVNIMFKVRKDGTIGDLRVRGPHKILENEAIRIIELLPNNFRPGLINGKPTNVPFSIPITFKLH